MLFCQSLQVVVKAKEDPCTSFWRLQQGTQAGTKAIGRAEGRKEVRAGLGADVTVQASFGLPINTWHASAAGREAVRMAERLVDEQAGVAIFALGVGRGVENTELDRIISVCGKDKAAARYMPLCTIDEAPW